MDTGQEHAGMTGHSTTSLIRLALMTKILVFICLLFSQQLSAALAPNVQDNKDLKVMKNFVKAHAIVKASLKSIDLRTYTIFFADDCEVKFTRVKNYTDEEAARGWVGPAGPLVFDSSTCDLE